MRGRCPVATAARANGATGATPNVISDHRKHGVTGRSGGHTIHNRMTHATAPMAATLIP